MRTANSPTRAGRNVITIALASAFLTLSACGSDNDDPAPAADDVNQLSPVVTDGSTAGGDTGTGNGGANGGSDNSGAGGTDSGTGNEGTGGDNSGTGGSNTGDNGGTDSGSTDTNDSEGGSNEEGTGDGGQAGTPDDGDIMMANPALPASSTTLDCVRNTGGGLSEALSAEVSFDAASMQFSVNGQPTILTDFTWNGEKAVWISTTEVVAGKDSVFHAGHVSLSGAPSLYLERLTSGGTLIEEVVCSAN